MIILGDLMLLIGSCNLEGFGANVRLGRSVLMKGERDYLLTYILEQTNKLDMDI